MKGYSGQTGVINYSLTEKLKGPSTRGSGVDPGPQCYCAVLKLHLLMKTVQGARLANRFHIIV